MFVDFEKTYNQKPLSQSKVPALMLNMLNENLPEGFIYESLEDGTCIVTSKNDNTVFGDLLIADEDLSFIKQYLGDSFDAQDVIDFSYNSQKPIKFKTKRNGFIKINDHEIPLSQYIVKPLDPLEMKEGYFYAAPPKFPEPFFVSITGGKVTKQLKVHRVPDYSVDLAVFESEEDIITIRYSINQQTNEFHCSVNLHVESAKTVEELVEALNLYDSLIKGNGVFANEPLLRLNVSDGVKISVHNQCVFWNKVLKIQPLVPVDFKPLLDDVDYELIRIIEELYQGLVLGKNYHSARNIITVKSQFNWDIDKKDSIINTKVFLKFNGFCKYECLGEKLEIPCNVYVINVIVDDVSDIDNQTELKLKYGEDSKTIIRMFLDKDLQEEDLKNVEDPSTVLNNAVSIKEIINNEYVFNG